MDSKIIERFYFGFLCLLPLLFYNKIIDAVLLPRQLLLGVFIVFIISLFLFNKNDLTYNILSKKLIFIVLLFLFLNLISFKQSITISESHAVFSKLILLFLFFYFTSILLYNDFLKINKLVLYVIVFGILSAITALYQIIEKSISGQPLFSAVHINNGNFANKNLLASILFLCVPFYFIGFYQNKLNKLLAFIGILNSVFVLVVIRTRVALLALALFFLLQIVFYLKEKFKVKIKYILASSLVILLSLFGVLKSLYSNFNLQSSQNVSKQYLFRIFDSETLKTRILFWENSFKMFKENWLLGVGLGNWQIYFSKYGLNNFKLNDIINGESSLQRPHNDFIWILCETGILGLITYLSLFAILIYQVIYLIKTAENFIEKRNFYILFSALIGYILISFFDFPYERIEHQILLMLIFAIISSTYYKKFKSKEDKIISKKLIAFFFIPVLYSLLVISYRLNGEFYTAKMYVAKNTQNWEETIINSKKANSYFYSLDNSSIPLSWFEGISHFNENRIQESEECFYKAFTLNPYNIQVINNLANVYQVNGKSKEAVELFENALTISNNFDEAKLNLSALYFNRKEFEKAFETINTVDYLTTNPKYKKYLIPILNNIINEFLKLNKDKSIAINLTRNITSSDKLLKLYFDSKNLNIPIEKYFQIVKF